METTSHWFGLVILYMIGHDLQAIYLDTNIAFSIVMDFTRFFILWTGRWILNIWGKICNLKWNKITLNLNVLGNCVSKRSILIIISKYFDQIFCKSNGILATGNYFYIVQCQDRWKNGRWLKNHPYHKPRDWILWITEREHIVIQQHT